MHPITKTTIFSYYQPYFRRYACRQFYKIVQLLKYGGLKNIFMVAQSAHSQIGSIPEKLYDDFVPSVVWLNRTVTEVAVSALFIMLTGRTKTATFVIHKK